MNVVKVGQIKMHKLVVRYVQLNIIIKYILVRLCINKSPKKLDRAELSLTVTQTDHSNHNN